MTPPYTHREDSLTYMQDSLTYMRDSRAQVAAFERAAEEGLWPPPFDPKTPLSSSALRLLKASNAFFELMKRK